MFLHTDDPNLWQDLYTENRAHADSLQKAGSLLVPSVFILTIPTFFGIFWLSSSLNSAPADGSSAGYQIFFIGIGALVILTPLLFFIITLKHLLKTSGNFLATFYGLQESINIGKMVGLRVFGRPPMPPPFSAWVKFPVINASDGKLNPPECWQATVGGPAKLKIEAGSAVYLERGNRFSRVLGQGIGFMELHETIKVVFNTGPQNEDIAVTAWTRDGIRVGLKAKVKFVLKAMPNQNREHELYSFDPDAARRAVESTLAAGREGRDWSKSAMGKTSGLLAEYISSKFLDEIFLSERGGQLLTNAGTTELINKINAKLESSGVMVDRLQILDVELPPDVNQRRIELWKTGHAAYAAISESELKAYQMSEQKKALAKAIRDFVSTLANGLERMEKTDLTEPILRSVYQVINEGMQDPNVNLNSLSKVAPDGIRSPKLDFHWDEEAK